MDKGFLIYLKNHMDFKHNDSVAFIPITQKFLIIIMDIMITLLNKGEIPLISQKVTRKHAQDMKITQILAATCLNISDVTDSP